MRPPLALLAALFLAPSAVADEPASPAAARLRGDVAYLADDAREGRAPGTPGIEAAAGYIADAFKKAGLKPAAGADGYFQPFTLAGGPKLGPNAMLEVSGLGDETMKATPETTFTSLSSRAGEVKDAPLAFAGYGITARDVAKKLDYDDYKDLDAKGRVVILLRAEPQVNDANSPFEGKSPSSYGTLRKKAANAAEHGAAMVVIVNNKASLKGEDTLMPDGEAGRLAVPTIMVTRAGVDDFLKRVGKPSLDELEAKIDANLTPASFPIDGPKVTAKLELVRPRLNTKNVVGVLEGSGPHAEETIVVGAHYDHLGRGALGGSLAFGSHDIHNGADDNASGTSMVIELARRLGARPEPLPRRVVFMAFSGEEEGLLGSEYYVNHPLYPLKNTAAMVNFDMVGRLNPANELTIFGAGTVEGLGELVDALGKSQGLVIRKVAGTGGEFSASDHYSFYAKNVPVLFAFTGTHGEYHKPADDTDLINSNGMARIADMGELILLDLARRPTRPAFAKLVNAKAAPGVGAARSSNGAYLGTRPAYGESDTPGVKLEGVTEGSPAEKAGLKGGDVIVKFAGADVKDIEDYMAAIGSKKPGDKVDVVVKRDGKEQSLGVTLGTRPGGN